MAYITTFGEQQSRGWFISSRTKDKAWFAGHDVMGLSHSVRNPLAMNVSGQGFTQSDSIWQRSADRRSWLPFLEKRDSVFWLW